VALEKLGIKSLSRLPFTLADGSLEREITAVLLSIRGRKARVQVAFAEAGEESEVSDLWSIRLQKGLSRATSANCTLA
jgi:hypothetical protein